VQSRSLCKLKGQFCGCLTSSIATPARPTGCERPEKSIQGSVTNIVDGLLCTLIDLDIVYRSHSKDVLPRQTASPAADRTRRSFVTASTMILANSTSRTSHDFSLFYMIFSYPVSSEPLLLIFHVSCPLFESCIFCLAPPAFLPFLALPALSHAARWAQLFGDERLQAFCVIGD